MNTLAQIQGEGIVAFCVAMAFVVAAAILIWLARIGQVGPPKNDDQDAADRIRRIMQMIKAENPEAWELGIDAATKNRIAGNIVTRKQFWIFALTHSLGYLTNDQKAFAAEMIKLEGRGLSMLNDDFSEDIYDTLVPDPAKGPSRHG